MILDRKKSPNTTAINQLTFPAFESIKSSSGVPVYFVNDPNCSVLKIEFVFPAGNRFQQTLLQAQSTNALITEGAGKYTAHEISSKLDEFGAYFQNRNGADDASLILFCLPKHLNSCLSIIYDIFTAPSFPNDEIETYKRNTAQRLRINESKTSYLARRAFNKNIYGLNNYGSPIDQENIANISRETLESFYKIGYAVGLNSVYISGNASQETEKILLDFIGQFNFAIVHSNPIQIITSSEKKVFVEKKGAMQNTIRIGLPTITRNHKDFRKLQFVNLILGGYFGSRLMKNIREEKGLTYGIYSTVETYKDAAAFYVETEINKELSSQGIDEIFHEINIIQTELIGAEELNTAKNYMLGTILRSFDGPFSITDRLKTMIDFKLSMDYYNEYLEIMNSMTPLEIMEIANTYFNKEALKTIVAGQE